MFKSLLCALVFLFPYLASAQVGPAHGTVIIFNVSEDQLIIAADSLAIWASGQPDYTQCKIETFNHQMVFVGVNGVGYKHAGVLDPIGDWDARVITGQIFKSIPQMSSSDERIQSVAKEWAITLAERYRSEYRWHPKDVISVALKGKGVLIGGVFAESINGKIYQRVVIVTFDKRLADPIVWSIGTGIGDCWPCGQYGNGTICAGGQIATATEFCTRSTKRCIGEDWLTYDRSLIDLGWDDRSLLALRIADLSVACDSSGTVGGKIDVVQLKKDGTITWLARKYNCPESQN